MGKRISAVLIIIVFGWIVSSFGIASAFTDTYSDTAHYWPGWKNNTGDDGKDSIGIPDMTDITVSVDDSSGLLSTVTVREEGDYPSYWNVVSPGDFFINANPMDDDTWDYFVDLTLTNWDVAGPGNDDAVAGTYTIYAIDLSLNDPFINGNYLNSGTADNSGAWSGYNIRQDHPVAFAGDTGALTVAGSADFSPSWATPTAPDTYVDYTFSFLWDDTYGIMGTDFILGWAANCANEVLYVETDYAPIPEPLSLFLLGSGLLGIGKLRRKQIIKN